MCENQTANKKLTDKLESGLIEPIYVYPFIYPQGQLQEMFGLTFEIKYSFYWIYLFLKCVSPYTFAVRHAWYELILSS